MVAHLALLLLAPVVDPVERAKTVFAAMARGEEGRAVGREFDPATLRVSDRRPDDPFVHISSGFASGSVRTSDGRMVGASLVHGALATTFDPEERLPDAKLRAPTTRCLNAMGFPIQDVHFCRVQPVEHQDDTFVRGFGVQADFVPVYHGVPVSFHYQTVALIDHRSGRMVMMLGPQFVPRSPAKPPRVIPLEDARRVMEDAVAKKYGAKAWVEKLPVMLAVDTPEGWKPPRKVESMLELTYEEAPVGDYVYEMQVFDPDSYSERVKGLRDWVWVSIRASDGRLRFIEKYPIPGSSSGG